MVQQVQRRHCWHLWDLRFHCLVPLLVASSFPYTPVPSSLIAPGVTLRSGPQFSTVCCDYLSGACRQQTLAMSTKGSYQSTCDQEAWSPPPSFQRTEPPGATEGTRLDSVRDGPCRELPWAVPRQRDYVGPSC